MADTAGIPRSRGGLSGLLLILLGAWGGLVPFVGPYFHYAFTPDRAWAYTSGRLWLEVAPGVAAALGGLILLGSRSRAVGGLGAFLAALGGAWFVSGSAITAQFVKSASIGPGSPVAATSMRQFLEVLGFFYGTGVVIVFFAALALGRLTVAGEAGSAVAGEQEAWDGHPAQPAGPEQDSFPAGKQGSFPAAQPEQYPAGQEQYPTMAGQYPPGGSQPASTAPVTSAPPDQFLHPDQFPPSDSGRSQI